MVGTRRTPEPPAAGGRVRLSQVGLHDVGPEVPEFLRDDGQRQAVLGVVDEFAHALLGV